MPNLDLSGDWNTVIIKQSGNQLTATAKKPNPDFQVGKGTLVGLKLTMTFTGGTYTQTYEGTVTPDGLSISWSNNTVWTKKSSH
jgi:hypothetical protein